MPKENVAATIQESMPKSWFFEIYEDTPEEESANLMEHSTLTLDLSSDDEGSVKDDRGKENCPPEGYDGPSRVAVKVEVVRKKVVTEEMDDGGRSPLSDLETEGFFSEGLDESSFVIVDGVVEEVDVKVDVKEVKKEVSKKRAASAMGSVLAGCEGEVVVWEDGTDEVVVADFAECEKVKGVEVLDENSAPVV